MWAILLLGGAVLYLLRNQEGFAGEETATGRALKDELIRSFRSKGVPEKDIPGAVDDAVSQLIEKGQTIYNGLKDKSQFSSRIDEVLLTEDAVREGGRALAEAGAAFLKDHFTEKPKEEPVPERVKEVTKAAGPDTGISSLNTLLEEVKDPEVRSMLQKYAELMIEYHTTGELAYKTAADRIMESFRKYVEELDAKAARDSDKVVEFIQSYDTTNKDVAELRDQLRDIRMQGPKLGDQYETQKKINEELAPGDPQYWLKLGLLVGLFLIGIVAKSYASENGPSGGYIVKSGLVIGLGAVVYIGFKSFFG